MSAFNARIAGTGSYLPEKAVTNEELEQQLDTSDEWISGRTGIKKRHIAASNETASSMAEIAARAAIEAAGLTSHDLDLILVATCTPDKIFPSVACLLQARLAARFIPAFDIQAACSGFVYGLDIARQYIKAGAAKHVLIVGVELMSRILDWSDRRTCILFGDGAGAVVVSASDEEGILSVHLGADGSNPELLNLPIALPHQAGVGVSMTVNMSGHDVFKFAVNTLGRMIKKEMDYMEEHGLKLDWLVPHQANLRIIDAAAKKLGLSMDQVIVTIGEHANTSSASIPLALDTAIRDGRIHRGQVLLLEAFGAGFTWGSALVRY